MPSWWTNIKLRRALKNSDWRVRQEAVKGLCDARAVKSLIAALKSSHSNVSCAAATALGKIGDARAVAPLIAALNSAGSGVRQEAAEALGELRDARAVEPLISVLNASDRDLFAKAAEALVRIGDIRAVEPLIVALTDSDSVVRCGAAHALSKLDWKPTTAEQRGAYAIAQNRFKDAAKEGPAALRSFIALLKDNDSIVRRRATEALGEIQDAWATEPLIAAFKDSEADVGETAGTALVKRGRSSVDPLIILLTDSDKDVRRTAAKTLGRLGWRPLGKFNMLGWRKSTDFYRAFYAIEHGWFDVALKGGDMAVKPLIEGLVDRDASDSIWQNAAFTLRKMDERAVNSLIVDPLVTALTDRDKDVRRTVAEALAMLDWLPSDSLQRAKRAIARGRFKNALEEEGAAVEPLISVLKDSDAVMRREAAATLGEIKIKDPRAVEPLIVALTDSSEKVRAYAAQALGTHGDTRATEPLIGVLKDSDSNARECAAKALGKIGDAQAVTPLIVALTDSNKLVRAYAAQALGTLGDTRATEPLIGLLKDGDFIGSRDVARALGKIGDARAIEALIEALRDSRYFVRSHAGEALMSLKWQPATGEQRALHNVALSHFDVAAKEGSYAVGALEIALTT